jgi:hypothetical protein
MSRSKSNKGNTLSLAKVEEAEAEPVAPKAPPEKAPPAKSIKTVTLLGGSRVTDPGTGVILLKNTPVIVPEISKWVKMQSKFVPPYLTFTE